MSNLLEVRHIKKSFGPNEVLKDISFSVPPGSIVGLIGDNGAGKSTTFKIALGLLSKDEGEVMVFGGKDLTRNPKVKEKIGVVFDAMNLPAQLTIPQLNKVFSKLYDQWDKERFFHLVKSFSLPLDKKISTFSRGMSMKVSVAVSLSHHAKLLLLDEATGGLDPSSREAVLDELQRFVQDGKGGIILSSHIMSDVEKVASHLVVIKNGRILLNEEKGVVFTRYALVTIQADQIGSVPNEIMVAKRNHGTHYRALISDKKKLPNHMTADPITMDEMSVLLTRSES